MAGIRISHDIGRLERDCAKVATKTKPAMARIVRKNVEDGNKLAKRFAKSKSGPHGKHYHKRISGEMTSALQGEYGPTGNVAGKAVGADWRAGTTNTDLPRSADVQGVKFAAEVSQAADRLFW